MRGQIERPLEAELGGCVGGRARPNWEAEVGGCVGGRARPNWEAKVGGQSERP